MLALTGEKADGWLPSLGHLTTRGERADANARIDEAAAAAGREPADVRRLLNVGGTSTSGPVAGLLEDRWRTGSSSSRADDEMG